MLPLSVAWETFGNRNGCETFQDFKSMILSYRNNIPAESNPLIRCIVLNNPVFFKKDDWIEVPSDWSNQIVTGKSYAIEEAIGNDIWKKVEVRLQKILIYPEPGNLEEEIVEEDPTAPKYGNSILTKVRPGQGAFRVKVTDAYSRRCAISGERTLPVLEAAHIKPYSEAGPHFVSNGILLRSDLHKLFDLGYLTIDSDYRIEVSNRIREEFQNGKEYYQFRGQQLKFLPTKPGEQPGKKYLDWHNSTIFKA
jgi:putative restriction endonuclease